jgi:hypothetical protein
VIIVLSSIFLLGTVIHLQFMIIVAIREFGFVHPELVYTNMTLTTIITSRMASGSCARTTSMSSLTS